MSLPEGWRETTLGEISTIVDGDRGKNYPNGNDFSSSGYCLFLNTKNTPNRNFSFNEKIFITKEKDDLLRKGKLQREDFILTTRGTVGNYAFYSTNIKYKHIRINSGMVILRVSEDKNFFYYYLGSKQFQHQIISLQSGSAQPQLPIKDLKIFVINLPSLQEQKAIANILSSFDDKIELLKEQNETLEQMAQGVFKKWFVDEVEESWKLATIGDIAILKSGKSRPKDDIGINNIPIYGGNGILGYTSKYNADGESIIIGRVGEYCGSLYLENKEIWISDNALLAKPLEDIYSKYLFYILKVNRLNSKSEGSSQPLLTQTIIKSIPISLPPVELLKEFHLQAIAWHNKINLNIEQIQTLQKTRDTLLPKLMSGEVRVGGDCYRTD